MGLEFEGSGEECLDLGMGFEIFLYVCFQEKVYQEDKKVQREKINEIQVLFIFLLFSLGHGVVIVAIYVAINFYFIFSIRHNSIFHPSLDGRDHFNAKLKCQ